MQPISVPVLPDGAPKGDVTPAGVRVAAVLERVAALTPASEARLLLTVESAAEPPLWPLPGWAAYRIPARSAGARVPRRTDGQEEALPFADAAFGAVCLCGAILEVVRQPGLLNKVRRMLRPGGTVVVVEPLAAFNYTVFPIGGPAHLVRRQLLQAGFGQVRALAECEGVLVWAGERPASASPARGH